MAVTKIAIKNLRALADTGTIELKPITILVGRNSVGKSTFARSFPLLRQSYEEKRRAPVLWWGKYVDYGSFDEAINRRAVEREIVLKLTVAVAPNRLNAVYASDEIFALNSKPHDYEVEVTLEGKGDNTFVRKTRISSGGLTCCVRYGVDGIIEEIQSGDLRWNPSSDIVAFSVIGELLPVPSYARRVTNAEGQQLLRVANPISQKVTDALVQFAHRNTATEKLRDLANKLPVLQSAEAVIETLKFLGTPTLQRAVESVKPNDPRIQRLRQWVLINSLPRIYRYLNNELRTFALGVRYLEPLRATAERYYRVQELAIDEIDSKGENLAVFINSLTTNKKTELNEWLRDKLGFEIESQREGGHISVKVRFAKSGNWTNLADTGFGISQVLPIAIQLWTATKPRSRSEVAGFTTCFVVEQPELHLHPAFQEKIADIFAAAIRDKNGSPTLPIIAETHSSSLINRLGELVFEGKIKAQDVQVLLFEQSDPDSDVNVRTAFFDEEGVLQNWPYGFFKS